MEKHSYGSVLASDLLHCQIKKTPTKNKYRPISVHKQHTSISGRSALWCPHSETHVFTPSLPHGGPRAGKENVLTYTHCLKAFHQEETHDTPAPILLTKIGHVAMSKLKGKVLSHKVPGRRRTKLQVTAPQWHPWEVLKRLHQSKVPRLSNWIKNPGASLVAQWLRIRLPMQRTWVWALVQEDPTCRGATRPASHNYWACASGACAPQQERPWQWKAHAPQWRVAPLAATRESPRTETKTQHSQK